MSLRVVGGSPRKLRLFAVACCRRLPGKLIDVACRQLVDAAEAFADGRGAVRELRRLVRPVEELAGRYEDAWRAALHADKWRDIGYRTYKAVVACALTAQADRYMIRHAADEVAGAVLKKTAERRYQADLLRDIYDNPFRPTVLDPAWQTISALDLAGSMYESRDFAAMPVLADALQDSGCEHPDILTHCREDGPHVRGCWVVDLILGKS
jgi:hypothetical protein